MELPDTFNENNDDSEPEPSSYIEDQRKIYPNHGKAWSKVDNAKLPKLESEYSKKYSREEVISKLIKYFGRTRSSIETKLERLIIKNAEKNDQYIFHCKICYKIIVRDYFLNSWRHCNVENKFEQQEGRKNYYDILKLKMRQEKLNAQIILHENDDSKKESSDETKPVSQPEPELEPESFTFLKELEEANKEKKSFQIYFKKTMKYDVPKFERIEDLKLFPPLEEDIKYKCREGIFEYQKQVFQKIRAGKNVAITAPTGTGKTLSFILPVIQKIINEGSFGKLCAVIVTPIKALTKNQCEQIEGFATSTNVRIGILTKDTPKKDKTEILTKPPEILLTNFDSIYTHLKYETKFAHLFLDFKILIVDEIHYYSGIHGSNVHHVIASLKRTNPKLQLIGASATIDNLKEFSQKFFDTDEIEIINSNQKKGLTEFVMIAPVGISLTTLLMNFCKELKKRNKQFLIFWDSKTSVEKFAWRADQQGIRIDPHRAGLKKDERKNVEDNLKNRKLDGVICTPTLELGIDIGSIEVVFSILVPWSKFKQRMGRAGRRDAPGYGFLMLGDDPVSEWFKKYPNDYESDHIVHINPKNKRVSDFMIPFRVLNTNKDDNTLIKKDEKIFLENMSVFKQDKLFYPSNEFVEGNRDNIKQHLENYNIRGMGKEVKIYQKVNDLKHEIGVETTPLAYQRFHVDAIYFHRKKLYKVIETNMLPNDEDTKPCVIVESLPKPPKYYTIPIVNKIPTIPSDCKFSEKIVGGIRIRLTDLNVDKTIRGYRRFNIYDDKPLNELVDNEVKAGEDDTVLSVGTMTPNSVIGIDGEEFTFRTRGIVLDIPKQKNDFSQEYFDGLHVIEHVLQHAGVTIANISKDNLEGAYDSNLKPSCFSCGRNFDPAFCELMINDETGEQYCSGCGYVYSEKYIKSDTEFKKIYVYDNSGDGESGAVEAIFDKIEIVILRAFEMLSLCEGPKNSKCDEPNGCTKCSFLMLKCSQFNENLDKPTALKILGKIVNLIFTGRLERHNHKKRNNDNEFEEIEKQFGHLIPNVSKQINKLKNSTIFKNLDNKNNDVNQKDKIENNEISKKISITEPIVENKDDWNESFTNNEYGFNSRNYNRVESSDDGIDYASSSFYLRDRFCSTCKKNGITHLPKKKHICDICGTLSPIILGPLTCGRYFSPNQNNGSDYKNSLLSKCILDNKHENSDASNLLSNFMFDFINKHPTFFDKLDFDLIIPVPNFKSDPQNVTAVSVSLKLSKLLNVACNTDILIKTQSTAGRKDHKSASERMNMANSSYDICSDAPIKNKSILLIDDVLVGGSTTKKCAKLLMENGANVILIMCLGEYSSYD